MNDLDNLPDSAWINRKQLRALVNVTAMTVNRWEAAGAFPRRIRVNGTGLCYWAIGDIRRWKAEQAAQAAQVAETASAGAA